MESVAERAGVTRLIVYRHFESKQALYRAVLDSVVESLRSEFDPAAPSGVAAMLLSVGRRHPDAFRLLWRHARHEPLFEKEAQAFRTIAAGFADDFIRPFVTDKELRHWGAAVIVDYLYGGICEWLDTGRPEPSTTCSRRISKPARGHSSKRGARAPLQSRAVRGDTPTLQELSRNAARRPWLFGPSIQRTRWPR